MKQLKIEIPEGYEIDQEKSTFENIVFRPIKNSLPKTWEELNVVTGHYVTTSSRVLPYRPPHQKSYTAQMLGLDRNVFAELEQAEAALALVQLSQLKKVYNGDWVPDWNDFNQWKYVIRLKNNKPSKHSAFIYPYFLSFKDAETRDLFLENFRDLIEQAKPLMS